MQIADPGDNVMVIAPYYGNFNADVCLNTGVDLVPVYLHDKEDFDIKLQPNVLENTLQQAARNGKTIKALLFTNPHNPLGRYTICYINLSINLFFLFLMFLPERRWRDAQILLETYFAFHIRSVCSFYVWPSAAAWFEHSSRSIYFCTQYTQPQGPDWSKISPCYLWPFKRFLHERSAGRLYHRPVQQGAPKRSQRYSVSPSFCNSPLCCWI